MVTTRWTLRARGFGTAGEFVEVCTVEAVTEREEWRRLQDRTPSLNVLSFARRDLRLERITVEGA